MSDAPKQPLRVLPVVRDSNHLYQMADSAAVTTSLSGFMELSFVSARSQVISQSFEVLGDDDDGETLGNPTLQAGPVLVEVAAIRMTPPALLETAVTVLRHLLTAGSTKADIQALLRDSKLID